MALRAAIAKTRDKTKSSSSLNFTKVSGFSFLADSSTSDNFFAAVLVARSKSDMMVETEKNQNNVLLRMVKNGA